MLLLFIFWKDDKILCLCPFFFSVCYILLQIQCEITAEIIHTVLQYLALNQRHPRDHNIISGITNYANTDLPCRVKLDRVISKTQKRKQVKCVYFSFVHYSQVFSYCLIIILWEEGDFSLLGKGLDEK